MKIFVDGIAGMIGAHLAKTLLEQGHEVSGLDNFNDYYDPQLKRDRVAALIPNVPILEGDINDITAAYFVHDKPNLVIHLAAYANPRHSLIDPYSYIETNIQGTQRLIDACEEAGIDNVIYASSSCVMHGQPLPWNETDKPELPNNMYGISKRANEAQFEVSKIKRKCGLRFFTVYGEWGRPDMALFLFTDAMLHDKPITVYNNGEMKRDFTYVGDIVQGIISLINVKYLSNKEKFLGGISINHLNLKKPEDINFNEIYNIGYGEQVDLMDFIREISIATKKDPILHFAPKHPADVLATWSNTKKLRYETGWSPSTPISEGVKSFIDWYKKYYQMN